MIRVSTKTETPARAGAGIEGALQDRLPMQSSAFLYQRTVLCACCRCPIPRASVRLLGVHAACWRLAGERIQRVSHAAIERRERIEIEAWVRDYCATEALIARAIVQHREGAR